MTARKTSFTIDRPREDGAGFLAAYFPVSDPEVPLSCLAAYEAARVDVVELGLRTDDPYADGPVVAASMRRATGTGTIAEAVDAIGAVRAFGHDAMGMIFAYAEPKLAPDPSRWADVDALLCPAGGGAVAAMLEADALMAGARVSRFVPFDMAGTAIEAARNATGFVMLQYTEGRTGLREDRDSGLADRVRRLRDEGITRPILTGIGLGTPDQARHAMDSGADGCVTGSRTLQAAADSHAALEDYLMRMREALDG